MTTDTKEPALCEATERCEADRAGQFCRQDATATATKGTIVARCCDRHGLEAERCGYAVTWDAWA
jgi:hypothetical protein